MPQLIPDPANLDDPALNAQRAAFIAVLADNGDLGRLWGNHTTGILGFAMTLGDSGDEYDAETRGEFCKIIQTQAEWLRYMNDQIQTVAMLLSGIPIPRYIAPVNLCDVMERAASYQWTAWAGKPPEVSWSEPNPIITVSEGHVFVMLCALVRHGSYLAQEGLHISVEREGDTYVFVFSGDTRPTYFTDPEQWFTINPKRGTESIGLFLARELATLNGGRVWVETANKTHFDFRLRLPITPNRGTYVDE